MESPECTDILMVVPDIIGSMTHKGGRACIVYLNQRLNQYQSRHEAIINGKPGKQAQAIPWLASLHKA